MKEATNANTDHVSLPETDDRIPVYSNLAEKYRAQAERLKSQLGWLSFIRLVLFIGFIILGYHAIRTGSPLIITSTIIAIAVFLLFIRLYDRIKLKSAFYTELVRLNENEITFLQTNRSPYAGGEEYIDPHHDYSYDLDLFGQGGLYGYLNRTSTAYGKEALAQLLLHADKTLIGERQEAIDELSGMTDFRQQLQAHGSLLDTKERELRQLKAWLSSGGSILGTRGYAALMLFPIACIGSLVCYLLTENEIFLTGFYLFFVLNLVIAGVFGKEISGQLSVSTSVTGILQQFAGQLAQIEQTGFNSPLLKQLQAGLRVGTLNASASIGRLASLFNYLETIINLVVSLLLNGLFLFHIHVLFFLQKWKKENGAHVLPWLNLLGEMEAYNSLANFGYNNPGFARPGISQRETLVASDMGHPLIRAGNRINNSIDFSTQPFVILTGSNMSGKSTFLRTLGINLVLARTGSRVCAKEFTFYPFDVKVSMRISDSLQDSESFFYAELKRLHHIIERLESGEKTFVILDEILRGTNSNDKHSGTVGLIRKLINSGAFGIIATHDLTVSELTQRFPAQLSNKCFESNIVNDELLFDYKLKEGVCTRLSASFLMKKMGVID